VGGTNPSLVEALWAGNPVIAHDNPFNRWTAGDAGLFFSDGDECERLIVRALSDKTFIERARQTARRQAASYFSWNEILEAYEREALGLIGESEPSLEVPPAGLPASIRDDLITP
jgi:glycosyltransferase involved in cell wall biosynthesis